MDFSYKEKSNLNLKGRTGTLLYYREVPTGRLKPVKQKRKGKIETIYVEETERVYFKEEEVRNFSLDKYGQSIPYMDGHLTIIHNYIFDYWGHFIGAEGVALYGHLLRYCYGKKDWCFPDMEIISMKMKKSINTVKKYLGILEKYGFCYRFNVQDPSKNRMNESNIYKVRKKPQFLSQDLIDQLPARLREDHDQFIAYIFENYQQHLNINLEDKYDYNKIYDDLLNAGEKVEYKSKSVIQREKELNNKKNLIETSMSEQDKEIWGKVLEELSQQLSKPTYDTFFDGSLAFKRNNTYYICALNDLARDWVQSRYINLLKEIIKKYDNDFTDIKIETLT